MGEIDERFGTLDNRLSKAESLWAGLDISGPGWAGNVDEGFTFNPEIQPRGRTDSFLYVNQVGLSNANCAFFNGFWIRLDEITAGVSYQVNLNSANFWFISLNAWQSGNTFSGFGCTGTPTPHIFSGGSSLTLSGSDTWTVKSWSVVGGQFYYDFIGTGPGAGIANTLSNFGGIATITSTPTF